MNDHFDQDDMSRLENFDELFVGDPAVVEKNLRELLPKAKTLENPSLYLQIMAKVALAEAMQKKFDDAHRSLNQAEKLLTQGDYLARARILLERGRVYQQSGNNELALPLFKQSFEISKKHLFDFHMLDAGHMIAIISENVDDKIKWNTLAISLAAKSDQPRGSAWLGSLYNNLGQAYLEAGKYEKAHDALESALEFRIKEGYIPNVRVAKWAVARALRLLHRDEEALSLLLPLIEEYDHMVREGTLDIPEPMLFSVRGLVYEELSELDKEKSVEFAALAYDDLSKDEWFKKLEPARLERLKMLSEGK